MNDEPQDSPAERKMRFLFQLRSRGVTDPRVLEAMEGIDRGLFVRGQFADRAYEDTPLPIPCGQTISQPSVVGLMTQALAIGPATPCWRWAPARAIRRRSCRRLCRRVYTVDRHRRLVQEAEATFRQLGLYQYHRAGGRRIARFARPGPLRPHSCDRRRRRSARPLVGTAEDRRYHGGSCRSVGRGPDPDPRQPIRNRVRL